ncbi:MAG: hypothetical protein J6W51_04720 [Fibrobacter sp.]|nr:hypothetical protein [Fibrobacter sp.]
MNSILVMNREHIIAENVDNNLVICMDLLMPCVIKAGNMNPILGMKWVHTIAENAVNNLAICMGLLMPCAIKAAIMNPLNKIYKYA